GGGAGEGGLPGLVRWDVLVPPEEVVGVVFALQRTQAVVLRRPIGLANPILALLHQDVHVDARMEGLEGRPEIARPLPLLVESLLVLGDRGDVEGVSGLPAVEGGVVL